MRYAPGTAPEQLCISKQRAGVLLTGSNLFPQYGPQYGRGGTAVKFFNREIFYNSELRFDKQKVIMRAEIISLNRSF